MLLLLFNSQRHENLNISRFVDTLVYVDKLLKESSIVFSFIIREKIYFLQGSRGTQGKKLWKFCENPVKA